MPLLKNSRHELFAQSLAKGRNADEAYAEAGYRPDRGNAARLSAQAPIQDRVAQLRERAAVRTEITVASVTTSLLRLADKAESLGDAAGLSASRACLADAAKLNGLVVDRTEIKTTVEVTNARERLAHLVAKHAFVEGA